MTHGSEAHFNAFSHSFTNLRLSITYSHVIADLTPPDPAQARWEHLQQLANLRQIDKSFLPRCLTQSNLTLITVETFRL